MIVKKHTSADGKIIVAICDSELVGKTFEDGKKFLDISSKFYKGEEKSEEEILEMIKDAYLLNIVGAKSIDFALRHKLIEEKNICKIKDIPYAQPYCNEK